MNCTFEFVVISIRGNEKHTCNNNKKSVQFTLAVIEITIVFEIRPTTAENGVGRANEWKIADSRAEYILV